MRRRHLIAGALGLTTGAALLPTDAAAGETSTIEDVIFGRISAVPLPDHQLAAQLAAARADFRACRYSQLARRLPRLLPARPLVGTIRRLTRLSALRRGWRRRTALPPSS